MPDFTIKNRRTAYEPWHGRFKVEEVTVQGPEGKSFYRDVVSKRGAVSVVAVTDEGKVLLVQQYRTPIDRVTLELPAGTLEEAEQPFDCARRELEEETGYVADTWTWLCKFTASPGMFDETHYMFMAQDLRFVGAKPDGEEEHHMDIVEYPLDILAAVLPKDLPDQYGEVIDAKTILGMSLTKLKLERLAEIKSYLREGWR